MAKCIDLKQKKMDLMFDGKEKYVFAFFFSVCKYLLSTLEEELSGAAP